MIQLRRPGTLVCLLVLALFATLLTPPVSGSGGGAA